MSDSSLANYLQAVGAAVRASDMERAGQLAEQALAQGHEHADFLTLAAYRLLNARHYEQALHLATRACALAPGNRDARNAMGICLAGTGNPKGAVAAFDTALAGDGDDWALQYSRAEALEQSGEIREACAGFARVFALNPAHADAAARLAYLSALRGEFQSASEYGLRALQLEPRQAFASFAVALAEIDAGAFEAARARLAEVADTPRIGRIVRALATSMLGDALDGMDRTAEAFEAYAQAGAAMKEIYTPRKGESALERVRRVADYVARAPRGHWSSPRELDSSPVAAHVFLIGFPRSGTTLLGQVLATHPDIDVLDEKDTLGAAHALFADNDALDRIGAMQEDALVRHREAYWARVAEYLEVGHGRIFVDKLPLNSVMLGLIAKLFPDAKVLVALRDPRDVVFSCFRRRFGITWQMYELLTLEGSAAYYDAVTRLCELYREKLALPFFDLRHEDLVGDFDGECRRVCAFLGLEYDAAMRGFAETARGGDVTTPSAAQVVRGLDTGATQRWRAYAGQMASIMPALAPWVERFGYGAGR